ncbi:uncharacterized protein DS421_5g165280 [Arachis hypogaea]|nr:uncharacterized protein DS421_5g165280 [Arachis hypogaea]
MASTMDPTRCFPEIERVEISGALGTQQLSSSHSCKDVSRFGKSPLNIGHFLMESLTPMKATPFSTTLSESKEFQSLGMVVSPNKIHRSGQSKTQHPQLPDLQNMKLIGALKRATVQVKEAYSNSCNDPVIFW